MKTRLLTMAALALTMASCSSNSDSAPDDLTNTPIKVNASVASLQSRAGYEGTTSLPESFYLYVTNATNTAYSYQAVMKKTDAGWTAYDAADGTTPLTMLWADSTTPVEVRATTSSDTLNLSVKADQSTEANLKASDHLIMHGTQYSPSKEGIDISLSHAMSKVELTLKLANEFAYENNPVSDITITGTTLSGKEGENCIGITPLSTGWTALDGDATYSTATYEAIICPQSVAAATFTVTFKIGNRTFQWVSENAIEFTKGKQYKYTLSVGSTKVSTTNFTLSSWNSDSETVDLIAK